MNSAHPFSANTHPCLFSSFDFPSIYPIQWAEINWGEPKLPHELWQWKRKCNSSFQPKTTSETVQYYDVHRGWTRWGKILGVIGHWSPSLHLSRHMIVSASINLRLSIKKNGFGSRKFRVYDCQSIWWMLPNILIWWMLPNFLKKTDRIRPSLPFSSPTHGMMLWIFSSISCRTNWLSSWSFNLRQSWLFNFKIWLLAKKIQRDIRV